MRQVLALMLLIMIGGCQLWAEEEPSIAQAIRDLDTALIRVIQVAGLSADVKREQGSRLCYSETRHIADVDIDGASDDPAKTVATVSEMWRKEGLTVQVDRTDDARWPQVTVRGRLIEMTITGFPDRKAVWIWGSTSCLPGEVPENWRGGSAR